MNAKRERVQSPSGREFVVARAPSGGFKTDDIYSSPFVYIRQFGIYLDLAGWLRHRFWRHGRWTVAAAKIGVKGKPTELSYSTFVPDRGAAIEAIADFKRRIQDGQLG